MSIAVPNQGFTIPTAHPPTKASTYKYNSKIWESSSKPTIALSIFKHFSFTLWMLQIIPEFTLNITTS
jgi:hypothetical protein